MNANDDDAAVRRAGEAIALAEASGDERALLVGALSPRTRPGSWPGDARTTADRRRAPWSWRTRLGDPLVAGADARVSAWHVYLESADIGRGRRRPGRRHPVGRRDRDGLPAVGQRDGSNRSGRCCAATSPRRSACRRRALAIGSTSGQPEALGVYGGQLMEIRQQQDRLDEIIEPFAQVAAENPGIPMLDVCLGGLFCMTAGATKAAAYIEDVCGRTGSPSSRRARSGHPAWCTSPTQRVAGGCERLASSSSIS